MKANIREPAYFEEIKKFDPGTVTCSGRFENVLLNNSFNSFHCIKKMDYTINTIVWWVPTIASTNAPTDAPLVIVKGTTKALAVTTDCNSRYVFADPYKGAMIAVSEAARNIVCSGGQPLGCYQLSELWKSLRS